MAEKNPPKQSSSPPSKQDEEQKQVKSQLRQELVEELKQQLKAELLAEIKKELKQEETEPLNTGLISQGSSISTQNKLEPEKKKTTDQIEINMKTILKIATHAMKYANKHIPQEDWVEVIGLLAGQYENDILYIEDAFPMGHGNAIYAEIKDYKNYARAFSDINQQHLFICGWYHSHPTYGLFLSEEDMGTQARYQRLWDKSVALVMDPYMINGQSYGFEIFRSNYRRYYQCPFKIKGAISPKDLPELLDFVTPIAEGKPIYLEYDE
jgi:proteasome lid subunit RPN8/RPN11